MIGIGTDLVDIDRFRGVLDRQPAMADRLFTEGERAYAEQAGDPVPRFAARFAAKEAALKALSSGLGAAAFREIEVVRAEGGAPSLVLHGAAAVLAAEHGVETWRLSLTHTDHVAHAIAVAF